MTCPICIAQLGAWHAGALSPSAATALEAHLATCAACAARADSMSRLPALSHEMTPPAALRGQVLGAVSRQRRMRQWRQRFVSVTGIAAAALIFMMTRPATKSASDFPGAGKVLLAMALAKPEFAYLDAAEHDVASALSEQPQDAELLDALQRIRRQRDALSQLVRQAPE